MQGNKEQVVSHAPGRRTGNSGPLPALPTQNAGNDWPPYQEPPLPIQNDLDENLSFQQKSHHLMKAMT